MQAVQERDERDSTRAVAPLLPAAGMLCFLHVLYVCQLSCMSAFICPGADTMQRSQETETA